MIRSFLVAFTIVSGPPVCDETDADGAPEIAAALKRMGAELKVVDGQVTEVDFGRAEGATVEQIRSLQSFPKVELIGTGAIPLTDEALEALNSLPNLRTLRVSAKSAGDGLRHLDQLTRVVRLVIDPTDEQLELLRFPPNLESLSLVFAREITNAGMVAIGKLPGLRRLDLGGRNITDDGLLNLKQLAKLRELFLNDTRVTGSCFSDLPWRAQITRLSSTQFDDDSIRYLDGFNELKFLALSRSKITDSGVREIGKRVPSLTHLELGGTGVSDEAISYLEKLAHLEYVSLSRCNQITDEGAIQLGKLKHLKRVNLVGCDISSEAVRALQAALPDAKIIFQQPALKSN